MLKFDSLKDRRDAFIRTSLLDRLKESVQSLLQGPDNNGVPRLSSSIPRGPVLGHTDNTNALCCIFEAIFIHGLKDSFGERFASIFLSDVDRMPVPNFWPVVMVISHRDLIKQVSALSFITSDVGKSRSWLRLALNSGQLLSYIGVLASDSQTLKDYYRPTAFFQDIESCDILMRVLQPISGISFNLSTNAAVLNVWTQTPLILSGVWIPSKGVADPLMDPVLAGTDVASTFTYESELRLGMSIPHTPLSDRMFDLIIGNTPETSFISSHNKSNDEISGGSVEDSCSESFTKELCEIDISIEEKCEDANSKEVEYSEAAHCSLSPVDSNKDSKALEKSENIQSDSLKDTARAELESIERHRHFSTSTVESSGLMNYSFSSTCDATEYRNLFSDWYMSESTENLPQFLSKDYSNTRSGDSPSNDEDIDFEVLSSKLSLTEAIDESEMEKYFPLFTLICGEDGIDAQNFKCNGSDCFAHIGFIHGKPRLCKYDGKYYCCDCHSNSLSMIPARVVHNWDFGLYPVCDGCKNWLDQVCIRPFLNLRQINPKLYRHVNDLAEIQNLRIQLHFIQAYLTTCRNDKGNAIRRIIWPREYLFEHVHTFSVRDLHQVYIGKLSALVRECVTEGTTHIYNCEICSQRGFICEICKHEKIIYPFQLGETFTCSQCCGVYHSHCVKTKLECPRCLRIKRRRMKLKELNQMES